MDPVQHFLAHAIQLEGEAARRYEELTEAMRTEGNRELREFFARMAGFSRMHLGQALARAGYRDVPKMRADDFDWPDGTSPEVADWVGVDAFMDAADALGLALRSERRGHAYYAAMAAIATDPEVRRLATEFAEEEAEHVAELERWVERVRPAR